MEYRRNNLVYSEDCFSFNDDVVCVKEFIGLDNIEIVELIERRLYSNNYSMYNVSAVNKSSGIIRLTCDVCGFNFETTLSQIEDGVISEKCIGCRQIRKDDLTTFKNEIQDYLKERNLVVSFYCNEEDEESLYIECLKCGKKYYLDVDFTLHDKEWDMYCKNWDCMIDVLASEKHWLAESLRTQRFVVKNNDYNSELSPFIRDYEDWVDSLNECDGNYELKCEKCNTVNVLPFGVWECEACWYNSFDEYAIKKWNRLADEVSVVCKVCGSQYKISCSDADMGFFDCFECYSKKIKQLCVCPVCDTEGKKYQSFCSTCGFPLDIVRKYMINNQTQYTKWIKNTIYPCACVWHNTKSKIR